GAARAATRQDQRHPGSVAAAARSGGRAHRSRVFEPCGRAISISAPSGAIPTERPGDRASCYSIFMGDSPTTTITLSPGGGFLLEPTGSATVLTPEMLSDEQRMMKETAEDFFRREVEPRTADIENKKPGVMRAILEKAGEV